VSIEAWQFFEWDYRSSTCRQYERQGRCNRCGECCTTRITYRNWVKPTIAAWDSHAVMGGGTDENGVWYEARTGDMRLFVVAAPDILRRAEKCGHLRWDGLCDRHSHKDAAHGRHMLCDVWPVGPYHAALFRQCSYRFEQVGEWGFDEH
jgi:hypothetical protein